MSISDTPNTAPPRAAFAAPGTAAPAPAASQPAPRTGGFSLLSLGNVGGLVRSSTSEALAKGFAATEVAVKESRINPAYKVHAIQIDNESERRLALSSIVLAIRHEVSGNVAFHTLLLEASADPWPAKIETINMVQVSIDQFASQAYDGKYVDAVVAVIGASFPGQNALNTGATVVPRTFNWGEKEDTRKLVQNAMLAAVTYLEARLPDFQDLDMSKIQMDAVLQTSLAFGEPEMSDYCGLPVRSDISITTTAVAAQRPADQSLNAQTENVPISVVRGYLDLTYSPVQVPNAFSVQVGPVSKITYQARFVITMLENMLRMTPAAQLLALATATVLAEGTNWYRGFKPNPHAGPNDPHDVGAVNIEANLQNEQGGFGTKIDTKRADFGDRELGGLLMATMHPKLAISIDVSDCGADTWFNRAFVGAASGDQNSIFEILNAANTLTGGHFARAYGQSTISPVLITDERILLGHYIGQNGQRSDCRQVDYLAVANRLGTTNPQAIADYSDTFESINTNQFMRLQGRKATQRSLCEQLTYTQPATRCTVNPEFLSMFIESLRACGVSFRLANSGMAGDYLANRGSGLLNSAGMNSNNTGLFSQGGALGQAAMSFRRPFQGQSMI